MVHNFQLAVVIVNYRTAALVIDCLHSLLDDPQGMPPSSRIVVVDGASADGSAERIAAAIDANQWAGHVALLPLRVNGGFAYANNRGVDHVLAAIGDPEYFLFLNPDTVVRPGALESLLSFMVQTPTAGVAGSRLEDHDTTAQACAFRFPSAAAELEGEARIGALSRLLGRWRVLADVGAVPVQVDWVSGASMMFRHQALSQTGGFDERFFLYYEEVDLCRRAFKLGWHCYHVPQSRVVHLVGRSTGVTSRNVRLPRRPDYWYRSRKHYFLKHHGRPYLLLADLAWIAGHVGRRAKELVRGRLSDAPPHNLTDFVRHSFRPHRDA